MSSSTCSIVHFSFAARCEQRGLREGTALRGRGVEGERGRGARGEDAWGTAARGRRRGGQWRDGRWRVGRQRGEGRAGDGVVARGVAADGLLHVFGDATSPFVAVTGEHEHTSIESIASGEVSRVRQRSAEGHEKEDARRPGLR